MISLPARQERVFVDSAPLFYKTEDAYKLHIPGVHVMWQTIFLLIGWQNRVNGAIDFISSPSPLLWSP